MRGLHATRGPGRDPRARVTSSPETSNGSTGAATTLWATIAQEPSAHRYRFGIARAARPRETLRRITPLLRRAGITRLADVTRLDRLGIPVYQAIRPNSRNLSVAMGKGLTRDQAKVSALMEALESYHAEAIPLPVVRETVGAMRGQLDYDPYALPLSEPSFLNNSTLLEWVAATDLCTGRGTWVPRQLCELDYTVQERLHVPLFRLSSNGLASGNTLAEALVHGLCEVVERDSTWRLRNMEVNPHRAVAPKTVDSRLPRRVLDRLAEAGIAVRILDASGPTGLPSFEVLLHDPDVNALHGGSGSHPSRAAALLRALAEAVQSRLTGIVGSRDDVMREECGLVATARPRPWSAAAGSFQDVPSLPPASFAAQVHDISGRIRTVTGMAPLAVELTRPEFGLPVVFVVAPGLRVEFA